MAGAEPRLMRKSALVAALGTAVTTGGAIAALTVLPLNSVSAQSSGTTATTDTTIAESTPTTTAVSDPTTTATAAAATTTTTVPSGSGTTATTAPATRACTPNEHQAHEAQETPE